MRECSAGWLPSGNASAYPILQLLNGFLRSCPGRHLLLLHPFDTIGLAFLPLFPLTGWFGNFQVRFSHYAKQGSTILSSVLIWTGTPIFWIADAQALKAVTSDRFTFMKDLGNVRFF